MKLKSVIFPSSTPGHDFLASSLNTGVSLACVSIGTHLLPEIFHFEFSLIGGAGELGSWVPYTYKIQDYYNVQDMIKLKIDVLKFCLNLYIYPPTESKQTKIDI